MNKIGLLISSFILLGACSSTPKAPNYYTISTPDVEIQAQSPDTRPLVLLEPIQLAGFLKQQGLVMLQNNNQMQFSSQHLWADKLDENLFMSILARMQNLRPEYRFESYRQRWASQPTYKIQVSFSHFNVNNNNQSEANGQFWIFNQDNSIQVKKHFSYRSALQSDGYLNAVSQLDKAVNNLTSEMSAQLLPAPEVVK